MSHIRRLNTWQLSFTFELVRNNYLTIVRFICIASSLHCLGIKGFPSIDLLHKKKTNKVTNHVFFLSTETIMKNFTAFLWVLLSILIMLILMNRKITIINWIIIGIPFDATIIWNYCEILIQLYFHPIQETNYVAINSKTGWIAIKNIVKLGACKEHQVWIDVMTYFWF